MATQNYYTIKNAALITPATVTDLGSASQPYGNLYLQGNLNLGSTTVTSTNVVTPKISAITYTGSATAANPAGGETITLTGSGFLTGASVYVGNTVAASATVVSTSSVSFVSPAQTAGNYTLTIVNTDGGTGTYFAGITYSALPVWSTAAGSLGTAASGATINTITLSASENAQTITYAVTSGSLPGGLSLSSSGAITGTLTSVSSDTTYNFTITATDPQNQTSSRNFSYTISAPPADLYFRYTTLLLNGEGTAATSGANNNTFLDSSASNNTIYLGGVPTQGTFTPFSKSGWSYYFDNNNYLGARSVNNSPAAPVNFASGTSWTVEAWIHPTSWGSPYSYIFSQNGSPNDLSWGFYSNSGLATVTGGGGLGGMDLGATNQVIKLNIWQHVALVSTGSVIQAYYNGSPIGSYTGTLAFTGATVFTIGAYRDGSNKFVGYMSNFRVVKGSAVYTSSFTPSTSKLSAITNTSLLTCANYKVVNDDPASLTAGDMAITLSVGPNSGYSMTIVNFSPFAPTGSYDVSTVSGSINFDGANDYLQPAGGNTLLNSSTWTVEAWIYPTRSFSSGYAVVFCVRNSFYLVINNSGYNYTLEVHDSRVGHALSINSGNWRTLARNSWTHVAVVNNNADSTLQVYINGTSVVSCNTISSPTGTLVLANEWSVTSNYFGGYISNFRAVKGVAVYTGSFTVPTGPLSTTQSSGTNISAITDTSTTMLLSGTNGGIIDQSGKYLVRTTGNGSATISTSVKKYGNGSISFAGTGGWIEPREPNNPLLRLGSSDWTFEFWLRVPNVTQSAIWLMNWNTDPRLNLDGQTLVWMTVGTARITTGNVLTANTWQHVAVVKYNGSTKIYVDGTQSGSTYTDGNDYSITDMDAIGYHPFTGYLDDIRITRGYARYTSNFTPPSSAFIGT
jgi:Concanavalin A-like lectin/glucanases superfamily/Putative Ig domain/IPT/TIG domain